MPEGAPIAKVEAATALGASVHLVGASVDESLAAAHERAAEGGLAFVHPFDDPHVIAGQGGVGLELLEQVPDIGRVIVPVGGGGLVSGIAVALKSERPSIEVIGVHVVDTRLTIADGIAVKRPGELTRPLIERWVDQLVTVSEDEIAEAMVFLLERAKLVVEGAGAVGVAALLGGHVSGGAPGTTVAILSGGNVDPGLLANIARHHESHAGRRLVLLARVPDRPGSLAGLLALMGDLGANLLDVQHIREGIDLHIRETAVQLVLETRGPAHAQQVIDAVRDAGYGEPPRLPAS
jgi:threonine dehydratase